MIRALVTAALLAAMAVPAMAQTADERLDALDARITRLEDMNAVERLQKTYGYFVDESQWTRLSELFTEDATYVEHHYGTFGGREAIRRWISTTMGEYPNTEMKYFPIEWYVIDEERGWIIAQVWNRFADPGDGSVHQAYNFTLLKYAGNGQFSWEEDVYNPARFAPMVKGYLARKKELASKQA